MRKSSQLSAIEIAALNEPGRYACGNGLYLQVTKSADGKGVTKSWLLRYMIDGRARQMGLGSLRKFNLKEARERTREEHQKISRGDDPIDAKIKRRQAARLEAARRITFRAVAERYVGSHEASWRNSKHAAQWKSTLQEYVYPIIGDLPVSDIDTQLVFKVLSPIWTKKTETAVRIRGRIEEILDSATAVDERSGENPARWSGNLKSLLPSPAKIQKRKHHPSLPYDNLPEFVKELQDNESLSAKALEFLILTAARTSQVAEARPAEIDWDEKIWTIPAERMKGNREHRVPLSDRAIEILKSLPRLDQSKFVFPGLKKNTPLSNMAMAEMVRGMNAARLKRGLPQYTDPKQGGKPIVPHGFRSTFKDWVAEKTAFPNIVSEMALAHAVEDKVEAAYRRGELMEKRRRLMREWAKFCSTPAHSRRKSNVTSIGTAR